MEQKKLTAGRVFSEIGRALCYLLLFLLCQVLISAVYSAAISLCQMLNPTLGVDPIELVYACTDQISLSSGLTTLVLLCAFFLLRRKNPLKEAGFHLTKGRFVFTAIAVTPILYTAVSLVLSLLPEAWMEGYDQASSALNQTGILMIVATVLLAPIVEEIIFRGLILTRLNRVLPGWLAVLLSALLFGVCHGQIVWMTYAFVLGVIFGVLALQAKSIWPSLCAHILFNSIGQLAVYLPETEETGLLFMTILLGLGVVLCLSSILYRALHPLKPKAT